MPRVLEGYSNVLDLGGTKLPCAVIEGPDGIQRVLSENGIANAILGGRSGASKRLKKAGQDEGAPIPLFVAPRQLNSLITQDLIDGPLKPIDYVEGDRVVRGDYASRAGLVFFVHSASPNLAASNFSPSISAGSMNSLGSSSRIATRWTVASA